eukprot:155950-Hanusia_phi.AAC.1
MPSRSDARKAEGSERGREPLSSTSSSPAERGEEENSTSRSSCSWTCAGPDQTRGIPVRGGLQVTEEPEGFERHD